MTWVVAIMSKITKQGRTNQGRRRPRRGRRILTVGVCAVVVTALLGPVALSGPVQAEPDRGPSVSAVEVDGQADAYGDPQAGPGSGTEDPSAGPASSPAGAETTDAPDQTSGGVIVAPPIEPSDPTSTDGAGTGILPGDEASSGDTQQDVANPVTTAATSPETEAVTAVLEPWVHVTKSSSDSVVTPGQAFTYTITGGCGLSSPPVDCVHFQILDDIPTELELLSVPASDANRIVTYDEASRRLAVNYTYPISGGQTGLAAGQSVTFDISVRLPVSTPLPDGYSIFNTANVSSLSTPRVITHTIAVTVAIPQVAITLTPSRSTLAPGQAITYSVSAGCFGATDCRGFTVLLQSFAPFTITSLPPSNADRMVNYDPATGSVTVNYTIPVTGGVGLPAGQVVTLAVGAQLNDPAPAPDGGLVVMQADVISTNPPAQASTVAPVTVNTPTVGISKSASTATVAPGQSFTYTLVVECTTAAVGCSNVMVSDVVPPEFNVTALPPSTGARSVAYDAGTRQLLVTYSDTWPAGQSDTFDIGVALPADSTVDDGMQIANTAAVAVLGAQGQQSTAVVTTSIPVTGSVSLTKTVDGTASGVMAGAVFPVTVTCTTNDGMPLFETAVNITGGQTVQVGSDLPMGARCWATETNTVGATSTTVTNGPANPVEVTPTGPNAVIGITNTYAAGGTGGGPIAESGIRIATAITGSAAPFAEGPFVFQTQCSVAEYRLPPITTQLTTQQLVGFVQPLPVGAQCDVTRISPQAATVSVTVPAALEPPAQVNSTLEIPGGVLTVAKVVTGSPTVASYPFTVTCDLPSGIGVGANFSRGFELTAGQSSIMTLPLGSQCLVSETDARGAVSTTYALGSGEITQQVDVQGDVSMTATNTYPASGGGSGDPSSGTGNGGGSGTTSTSARAPSTLPRTGGAPMGQFALMGVALLALGVTTRTLARR